MILLYWNVRGIGNVDTKIALKNFFTSHKPLLIFVSEPMIDFNSVPPWYWDSIGVSKYCVNCRDNLKPNLWALWGSGVNAVVMFISDQCIALEISCHQSTVYIAAVYASTYYLKRRQLWADLTNLQGYFQGPWLFIGDFNAILGAHEKRGRRCNTPFSQRENFVNKSEYSS